MVNRQGEKAGNIVNLPMATHDHAKLQSRGQKIQVGMAIREDADGSAASGAMYTAALAMTD